MGAECLNFVQMINDRDKDKKLLVVRYLLVPSFACKILAILNYLRTCTDKIVK